MSKADQDRIVAVMVAAGPEERWTLAALGKATGIAKADVARAVQSLRFAGKMAFDACRLKPSMFEQDIGNEEIPQPAAASAGAGRTGAASIAADAPAEAGAEVHGDGISGGCSQSHAADTSAPAEARSLQEEIAAEAMEAGKRRKVARATGGTTGRNFQELAPLAPLSAAEQLLSIAHSDFAEFAETTKRRWPGLWFMALETARAQDSSALRVLFEAVQLGLEQMQDRASGQRRFA